MPSTDAKSHNELDGEEPDERYPYGAVGVRIDEMPPVGDEGEQRTYVKSRAGNRYASPVSHYCYV